MPETHIFQAIDEAASPDALIDLLSRFYHAHGFDAVCFVFPKNADGQDYVLFQRGMPLSWLERYDALEYANTDPVPEFTMKSGQIDTLYNVFKKASLTEEQKHYVSEFLNSEMTDGLAIPTLGRGRARGFFGLAQTTEKNLASIDRSLMHAVAQHAHWKYDQMEISAHTHGARLSPRELEILNWIAAGKSNPDIAVILGISLPTVATHLKRIFAKLGVNDRVSAAMKGQRLNILNE